MLDIKAINRALQRSFAILRPIEEARRAHEEAKRLAREMEALERRTVLQDREDERRKQRQASRESAIALRKHQAMEASARLRTAHDRGLASEDAGLL